MQEIGSIKSSGSRHGYHLASAFLKIGQQRHAFFNRSRVIKNLDFGRNWYHLMLFIFCITFIYGVMQLENCNISKKYFSSF
jgi:hypothetical protein